MLYGSLSAFEASRDLFVGPALRDKCEDFLLARTKITPIIVNGDLDSLDLADQ